MKHFRIGLLIAAGAAGAMVTTAPAAFALSESTIKSECAAANGTYTTTDYGAAARIPRRRIRGHGPGQGAGETTATVRADSRRRGRDGTEHHGGPRRLADTVRYE